MSVIDFCAAIGTDPLLVQGAGGNVSWKDKDILWVKASGTWLADADKKNIFVPIALAPLREAFERSDFSVTPTSADSTYALKPSIETLLHALMPHPVVAHLHAVEILAHLVRPECKTTLSELLPASIRWALVDYHKPGAPLAQAIHTALCSNPDVDVVFLQNHGVVIGGQDIDSVKHTLHVLTYALHTSVDSFTPESNDIPQQCGEFVPVSDLDIHLLALNPAFFDRLHKDWALFPDHIVFLGAKPHTYETDENIDPTHEVIFVRDIGVFVKPTFTQAKYAQLRCYYDVLARQSSSQVLSTLTPSQIAELLNWDAEHYRINMEK